MLLILAAGMISLCFGGQEDKGDDHIHDDLSFGNTRRFSYMSLQIATNNFSDDTLIGHGGYAKVYRGVLPNKTLVAVKKYYPETENQQSLQEFLHMVEVMSFIRHRNINRVIGYCICYDHRLLVTEYVDNGSLYDLLHNQQKRKTVLDWSTRSSICIGIARALSHLHEGANPHVIHRDIKPGNILLDTNFTHKITDFDLVMLFHDSDELSLDAAVVWRLDPFFSNSSYTTQMMGTLGYMDPEYLKTSKCTDKSDVYGFGVVMLEILSGKQALDCSYHEDNPREWLCLKPSIVEWALHLVRRNRVLDIIDPVMSDFPTGDVQRFIDVAFLCIKKESKQRLSMREVMQMLDGVCNSKKQPLTSYNTPYISAVSSFRSSIGQTNNEGEGETELLDLFTGLQSQGETESNTTTVSEVVVQQQDQHMGIILSGSENLVERLSQTTVFKKSTKLDFPEAVYPPFRTRVFRRGGSRNLYTF